MPVKFLRDFVWLSNLDRHYRRVTMQRRTYSQAEPGPDRKGNYRRQYENVAIIEVYVKERPFRIVQAYVTAV